MKLWTRILFCVVLAATIGSAVAQPQRQNRGQGSMAFQQALAAEEELANPLQLIFVKEVQRYLGLDLGQRNKLDNFHDKQANDLRQSQMQNRRNRAAVDDLVEQQKKDVQDKIDELLTKDQIADLTKLSRQLQGNRALFDAKLQKEVGITPDQSGQLLLLSGKRDQQIRELANSSNRRARGQDPAAALKKIDDDTNAAIGKMLTDDQKAALKQAFGRPFKPGGS